MRAPIIILQLDPGEKEYRLYTLSFDGGVLATILVANTEQPGGPYVTGVEYWQVDGTPTTDTQYTMTWVDENWSETPSIDPNWTVPQPPSWETTAAPRQAPMLLVSNTINFALAWDLGRSPPQLNWYGATFDEAPPPGTVFAPPMQSGETLTSNLNPDPTPPPSGGNLGWYICQSDATPYS